MTTQGLYAHLASGSTTVCRAWTLQRRDGLVLGFTDHDRDLTVDGVLCRAETGMTAKALQQVTGLSVDNSEAVGALSDAAVREDDIRAGRFDGAVVRAFLVNWTRPEDWVEQFRGSFGEITRSGGAFKAELRGLSEALNRLQGYAYQPSCSAVLGDDRCRFDIGQTGFLVERSVEAVEDNRIFFLGSLGSLDDGWFEHGRLEMLTGAAAGLVGAVKIDRLARTERQIELWQSLGAEVLPGDMFRLTAGCNKTAAACRTKFANFLNFRGFPHIPGDDFLTSYPTPGQPKTGGSLMPRSRG